MTVLNRFLDFYRSANPSGLNWFEDLKRRVLVGGELLISSRVVHFATLLRGRRLLTVHREPDN